MKNGPVPTLSEVQVAEAVQRYQAGEGTVEIGHRFSVHAVTVRRSLIRAGVTLRDKREARLATVGSPVRSISAARWRELYCGDEWVTIRALAASIGASPGSVRTALLAAGITLRGRKPAAPKPVKAPKPPPLPKPEKKKQWQHGEAARGKETPEHRTWRAMKRRCNNPSANQYCDYGGRGIRVCERWEQSYAAFLADMGRRPTAKHSIDRIDVNGDYEPGNCRWATRHEQALNTRRNT